MGWFGRDSSKQDNPVNKLDPELREYLERERPSQYVPSEHAQDGPRPQLTEPASLSRHPDGTARQADVSESAVPSASLFPDGRYAHLWKTYKPPQELEESGISQAERVIEKFKEHKDSVHRAAMENCALENEALTLCFQTGSWQKRLKARVTMCSEENSTFSRCFTTQAKFLQALGYASAFDWDEEREERIQMHADKLYHQMLDYEKEASDAKAAGREPPPLQSLFHDGAHDKLPSGFTPSKQWHQLSPHERELEIQAFKAHQAQQALYAKEAMPFVKSHDDARTKRREKAVGWFGETIGKWVT